MFVPFDRSVRIQMGVVTLGGPTRLSRCLEALVAHESEHDFVVSLLVNPLTVSGEQRPDSVPDGVRVELARSNLGWAGGLHRLRALSDAELFVWVQDDMTPHSGWLDALVAAADAHPRVGVFGSVGVDDHDRVLMHNGGRALPPDQVAGWSSTDTTPQSLPSEVSVLDWVTSKGCLTRVAAFDEVGGPDPRLWPLNRVDLDYCTHLRCHGWDVALVPDARLRHAEGQSAPSALRTFLLDWRDDWFDARWSGAVREMHDRPGAVVDHPCAEWRELRADPVEVAAGIEASRMLVPLARAQARAKAEALEALAADHAEVLRQSEEHAQQAVELFETARRQARELSATRRRLKRRARRLRRERDAARADLAARHSPHRLSRWRPRRRLP